MTPIEFKERFQKAQPEVPEGVNLEFGNFCSFPKQRIEELMIDEQDKQILRDVGFPEESAPYLSFADSSDIALRKLTEVHPTLGNAFDSYKIFGSNGSGDFICIDERDGSIVYLNHDWNMKRVFINSSLSKFAESLCVLTESLDPNEAIDFMAELLRIDPPALEEGAMWPTEHKMLIEE